MKRIILLLLFACFGLSAFAQIVALSRTHFARPNQINFFYRSIDTYSTIKGDLLDGFSIEILIGKKRKIMDGDQIFEYKGKIADTMRFVFDAPDYQRDTFMYIKKIHYDPYSHQYFMYVTPKGKQVNKIVILGDAVDVYVGGEKYSYTVQELGRTTNDATGNAQMILKIPDLTFKDHMIYVKNQPISVMFVDRIMLRITGKTPESGLLKKLQEMTQ